MHLNQRISIRASQSEHRNQSISVRASQSEHGNEIISNMSISISASQSEHLNQTEHLSQNQRRISIRSSQSEHLNHIISISASQSASASQSEHLNHSIANVLPRQHFTCQTFRQSEFQSVVNRTDVSPSGIAALVASRTISYVFMCSRSNTCPCRLCRLCGRTDSFVADGRRPSQ